MTLFWVVKNFSGKRVCVLHVHQPEKTYASSKFVVFCFLYWELIYLVLIFVENATFGYRESEQKGEELEFGGLMVAIGKFLSWKWYLISAFIICRDPVCTSRKWEENKWNENFENYVLCCLCCYKDQVKQATYVWIRKFS